MLASVSVIIHTAWRVNFNLPLDALEHSIRGVRALVDFAREASRAGYTRQEELIGVAREAQLAGARQAEPVEDLQRDPHARSFRFLFTSSTTAARSWEDVSVVLSGDADMTSSPEDVDDRSVRCGSQCGSVYREHQ